MPFNPEPIINQVINEIERRIENGFYKNTLAGYVKLSKDLNVSCRTVKKALEQLEIKGIVGGHLILETWTEVLEK